MQPKDHKLINKFNDQNKKNNKNGGNLNIWARIFYHCWKLKLKDEGGMGGGGQRGSGGRGVLREWDGVGGVKGCGKIFY